VSSETLAKAFASGPLSRTEAVTRLMGVADIGKSTAYRALDPEGEFKNYLTLSAGLLTYSDPLDE
jgi:hypothetical protein